MKKSGSTGERTIRESREEQWKRNGLFSWSAFTAGDIFLSAAALCRHHFRFLLQVLPWILCLQSVSFVKFFHSSQ